MALALEFAFWGRPVPTHSVVAPAGSRAAGEWVIHRRESHRAESWRAKDTDGDGVMDEFHTSTGTFARPGLGSPPKRWLVICLDGVPLGVLQRLWDHGQFREFYRPSAVVSVFPSDSEAAMTDVLHAAPVPGYEHLYFDRSRNRMRGGAWVTLTGARIPYIRVLDYDPPGWAKAIPYILPRKTYRADLGRLRKSFLAGKQAVFLAHVSSTDSLSHMLAEKELEPLLIEFESLLRDFYLDARGELGVIVFSDHGNTLTPSRAAPLETFLARRGWRLRDKLEGPRDVAVPAYGLIGFFAVYCQTDAALPLAEELTALEGVDLAVVQDRAGRGAIIFSAGGRAQLTWSEDGRRYAYAALQGDPLGLAPVFAQLRAAGRLASDGSASDADLFAATAPATTRAPYPDAAARIRAWAINHVENRANIMVSLKPGYFYGAGIFQHIVTFAGTHGALDARSSLGFAMATYPLPPAVRLAGLLPKDFVQRREIAE